MSEKSVNKDTFVSSAFKKASYILVGYTFLLMMLGGYVKAIGAGLSCPDWPLCYQSLFPFFDKSINTTPYTSWQVFSEWFHRLIATFGGVYAISVVYYSRKYKFDYPVVYTYGKLVLFLFITQGLWGGLTVIRDLNEFIVVAHLANAVLILIVEMLLAFYSTIYSDNFNI